MYIIEPPKFIISILTALNNAGFEGYMVGGCVRDMIMGRSPSDWDLCTNALPEDVTTLFPGSLPTGIKHGTVTVRQNGGKAEVTTFRTEAGYSDHRRPDFVSFDADLNGDLSRRDFTCNAMAMDRLGSLHDPFGGLGDIDAKIIRCVGSPERRFGEDALRMFRAMRFSAQLDFEIEAGTLAGIRACAPFCADIAPERACAELYKLLLSPRPELAGLAVEYGLLDRYLTGGGKSAPGLSRLSALPMDGRCRWAGLSAALLAAGRIENAGAFLKSLRLDGNTISDAARGVEYAMTAPTPVNAIYIKRACARLGISAAQCAAGAVFAVNGGDVLDIFDAVIKSGDCLSLSQLAVKGADLANLGYSGPQLGRCLNSLLEHVLQRPGDNRREILLELAESGLSSQPRTFLQ